MFLIYLIVENVVDGGNVALFRPLQIQDNTCSSFISTISFSSTTILKEKNHDITDDEEAEIQRSLSQALSEIQTLIIEGQRLMVANPTVTKRY